MVLAMFGAFKRLWKNIRGNSDKSKEKKDLSAKTGTAETYSAPEQKPKKGLFSFWKNMFKSKKKEEQKDIGAPAETDQGASVDRKEKLEKEFLYLSDELGKAKSALEHQKPYLPKFRRHIHEGSTEEGVEPQDLNTAMSKQRHLEASEKLLEERITALDDAIEGNRKAYAKYEPKKEAEVAPHEVKASQTPKRRKASKKGRTIN